MSGKILSLSQQPATPASEHPVALPVGRDTELTALHQRLGLDVVKAIGEGIPDTLR